MKNKAYAQFAVGEPEIAEIELDLADPAASEVVVRVTHAGVCHTDIHVREGGYDLGSAGRMSMVERGVAYPLIMGHEIAGEIIATGPDVHNRSVGEAVVVYPWLGCGECATCEEGAENLCVEGSRILGIMRPGGYADLVSVPHEKYAVPLAGVDPEWAATLACSGLTAVSAAEQVAASKITQETSPVAVIGAGGVGLMCLAALAAKGMSDVTVVDRSDVNFEQARSLGAARCVVIDEDTSAADLIEAMGAPPVAVVDVVNSGATMKLAYDSLRKGGCLVTVGLFGGEMLLPTATVTLTQKSIVGNYVGSLGHLHEALALARDGHLPRIPITTVERSAESIQRTLDDLQQGLSRGRTVLTSA
ncbi:alcohol dehydrogenase catalytic domain-containing protein [Micrococcus luteus]|uniref:alcohol dehydrogenase catalytic domain-containing protein n=1 Tax=Micrococcus TaxID=1269 RepID=UPI000765067D|nr:MULTISPECIES: alcohol dehydrogenase catalytic domain-containing protein [Micrococcus]CVM88656.1 alcohol dehydrogenase [Streptococcus pneumoniae]MBY0174404.1 alcohol dehydrogenase catalytic domain-containing protein [Micrococcus luteus]MCD0182541.1 alcohol dehydrogenase catalytic domain-containing protein [Micrococcus luteus]MCT2066111.1 alcohol dehydrogenase catalytic domain-containing protein [Micrococcus luteus]MCV7543074.1 alcohol dehydrogenase catalytic domain-containing protein [Microc